LIGGDHEARVMRSGGMSLVSMATGAAVRSLPWLSSGPRERNDRVRAFGCNGAARLDGAALVGELQRGLQPREALLGRAACDIGSTGTRAR
jgi:hypothetical protein